MTTCNWVAREEGRAPELLYKSARLLLLSVVCTCALESKHAKNGLYCYVEPSAGELSPLAPKEEWDLIFFYIINIVENAKSLIIDMRCMETTKVKHTYILFVCLNVHLIWAL